MTIAYKDAAGYCEATQDNWGYWLGTVVDRFTGERKTFSGFRSLAALSTAAAAWLNPSA